MNPETISKIMVSFAIGLFVCIVAFNMGRLDRAKPQQCEKLTYTTPFKGTLP